LQGIALSSPLMTLGAVVGAMIGTATAWALTFDLSEVHSGIYGFNATLVGIATLFLVQPGPAGITLLVVGCVLAALVTWLARRYVPFPTDTAPFIVTTWTLFLLGLAPGAARVEPGGRFA
jgi:urea transporter